jgi:hypothetical protein
MHGKNYLQPIAGKHGKVISLLIAYAVFSNRFTKNSLLLQQQNQFWKK